MLVIAIIIIILLVLNFVFDIAYVHTKNKYINIIEKQNTLLWALIKEGNDISNELIKENLKKDGGQSNEIQKETDSD